MNEPGLYRTRRCVEAPRSDEPDHMKGTNVVPSQSTEDRLADLSAFQLRVLRLMATGLSNTAIAASLGISRRAVENHVSRLLHALGLVQDDAIAVRVCAVLIYLRHADAHKHPDPVKHADGVRHLDGAKLAEGPKRREGANAHPDSARRGTAGPTSPRRGGTPADRRPQPAER